MPRRLVSRAIRTANLKRLRVYFEQLPAIVLMESLKKIGTLSLAEGALKFIGASGIEWRMGVHTIFVREEEPPTAVAR
ncbi:MAG: hypothetical protein CFE26_05985 [Verrucomicrobiales bacterium VVV1]|nr:MAG: hypothetical protein CFE26_05985 [Verrucomicrobiales bacterium VVV1]